MKENWQFRLQERHRNVTEDQFRLTDSHTVGAMIDITVGVINIVIKVVRRYPANPVISIIVRAVSVLLVAIQLVPGVSHVKKCD